MNIYDYNPFPSKRHLQPRASNNSTARRKKAFDWLTV